ncbi:hypothetical protein D4R08_07875 [Corynebacterium xerosis]|uniref:UvrD family DEAD/DEAH box helicase n=1 Tax=Corynebacterium xerosis TaxID=1725 RepID=UPI000EB45D35|nr:UvrD family DEAD/DEAH box helicase [Corynebacterium xerosis]AYJ33225.1 hypothetical protein D4R08_07875 [Corynebacterium xerosis]
MIPAPTVAAMCDHHSPAPGNAPTTRDRAAGPCTRPIVMRDENTGLMIQVRCGARLAEDCPSCAARYTMRLRRYQGENLGLKAPGGDLIDPEDAGKVALFATGTLPSFGRVFRGDAAVAKGMPESWVAGAPANPAQYGYIAHALHHLLEPQLLNVWSQSARRWSARLAEAGWRATLVTNREEQARRAGHWHALVTVGLDGSVSPHPGYHRTGPRRKVPSPHVDTATTAPVVAYDGEVPERVTWLGPTGTTWWEQALEPWIITPETLLSSFEAEVGHTCSTAVPSHWLDYLQSEVYADRRRTLGLPPVDLTLVDDNPAHGYAAGDLPTRVHWGQQCDLQAIGSHTSWQHAFHYATKAHEYTLKDAAGKGSAERPSPDSPAGAHTARLQRELLAMAPMVATDAIHGWARRQLKTLDRETPTTPDGLAPADVYTAPVLTTEAPTRDLTDAQLTAVTSTGAVRVLAGPGAGKTRTLVARVHHLIASGVKPNSILCIAFTRDAAAEVRSRLGDSGVVVSTWHSWAAGLLGRDAQGLSYDELLEATADALEGGHPTSVRHVLVDEYQDTDPVQRRILVTLGHRPTTASVLVVGDPRQAIYGWRGADAGVFAGFLDDFPEAHTIDLAANFRSTPPIVTAAQAHAPGLTMTATRTGGDLVQTFTFATEHAEARAIAAAIAVSIDAGHDAESHAVLTRTRARRDLLAAALSDAGIIGVEVLTIHAAKGREWSRVWVAGMEHPRVDQPEDHEVLFVALSRARDVLTLSHANQVDFQGRRPHAALTRLITAEVVTAPTGVHHDSPVTDARRNLLTAALALTPAEVTSQALEHMDSDGLTGTTWEPIREALATETQASTLADRAAWSAARARADRGELVNLDFLNSLDGTELVLPAPLLTAIRRALRPILRFVGFRGRSYRVVGATITMRAIRERQARWAERKLHVDGLQPAPVVPRVWIYIATEDAGEVAALLLGPPPVPILAA